MRFLARRQQCFPLSDVLIAPDLWPTALPFEGKVAVLLGIEQVLQSVWAMGRVSHEEMDWSVGRPRAQCAQRSARGTAEGALPNHDS